MNNRSMLCTEKINQNLSLPSPLPTLVFIDSGIDQYELLVEGILPTTEFIILERHRDGVIQISEILSTRPASNIQIIAHGSPGSLQLGNSQLNLNSLHTYRLSLQQWQAAEILIYGCEVAAGETGQAFIEGLHQLTGANIAASTGKIGNAQQGGTWELEVKIGQIATTLALKPEAYPGVLASFATATNFTVGNNPRSVAVGDFNSDGKLDMATANRDGNNVSVLLGNGTGSFATATNFTVGSRPLSVAVADFNSDGKLDMATANRDGNNVSVLLGNGTGGFGTATNFTVGSGPFSVAVRDFNGDGNLDMATANNNSNNVSVLLGDGTGSFATATNFTVGSRPYSVAVGDFNGDGKLDTATANYDNNNVSVLLGNGTGGFGTATNFTVGNSPYSVAVGDFNGDGKLDMAAANYLGGNVSVLLGNGTGGFGTAANFTVGSRPLSVAVADFNGDGKLDMATANYFGDNVSVLLGDGTGSFATATNFTVGSRPLSVAVTDFNGDGKLDMTTTNESGNVSLLLNNTPKISITPGSNPKEGGPGSTFTITLDTPAPVGGLVVSFNTNGSTATSTTDYNLTAGTNITAIVANTFTIAAGQITATLGVQAVTDTMVDPNETVIVNLLASQDYILNATAASASLVITEPVAPTISSTTSTALAYIKNDPSTVIDNGITLSDVDSTNLVSATVKISSGLATAEDILALTNQNGISGTYDSNTGTLNLTGTATVAQYQTALNSITYRNSSDSPSTTPRTISFSVNDGSLNSTAVTRQINIKVVNNAPTDLALSATRVNENVFTNTVVGTFTTIDPDINDNFTYSLVAGTGDTDNTAFTIDGDRLKIKNSPDFETKSSYNFKVRTTDAGGLFFDKALTINVNDLNDNNVINTTNFVSLTKVTEDTFRIKSKIKGDKAKFSIKLEASSSKEVNELCVFIVDDATGKINGIAPGTADYAKAALERSQVIFSAIAKLPNGFNTNLESFLEFNSDENIRFFSVRNSTASDVLSGKTSFTDVTFATSTNFKTQDLGDEGFSIGLEDFKIKMKTTEQQLPLGIGLQGKSQGEIIDLRQVTSQVKAEFTVNREAAYNNSIGFYEIADENGGIDTNGDGTVDLRAGDAGYIQAAINGRLAGIDLNVNNQGTATFTGTFKPGSLFAPFIIVNGKPEAILDSNASNDPQVYLPFLGSNSSNTDHVRLLGNNTFGFEDLPGGGDKDYNDMIVKVNLSIAST